MPVLSTFGASAARSLIDSDNTAAQKKEIKLEPGKVPDPFFNKVDLLLHSDTHSTLLLDSSFLPKVVTAKGNAKITQSGKFGKSSILLESPGDYLSVSSVSIPAFTDFTVEGWIKLSTHPKPNSLSILVAQNESYGLFVHNTGKSSVLCWYKGSSIECSTKDISLNVWSHFAATRRGSTISVFLEGKAGPTYPSWNIDGINFTNIGGNDTTNIKCNLDELRISNGISRYSSNFIPTTEMFSDG
jgi:hypothetical protein